MIWSIFSFLNKVRTLSNNKMIVLSLALGITSFVVGLLIGFMSKSGPNPTIISSSVLKDYETNNKVLTDLTIDVENVKRHLKYLSSVPHLAGTVGDLVTAKYVYQQFESQGLDSVGMNDYDVYLDFSHRLKYNKFLNFFEFIFF